MQASLYFVNVHVLNIWFTD